MVGFLSVIVMSRGSTITVIELDFLKSSVAVQVIVAVPGLTAVNTPSEVIVATVLSVDFHVSVFTSAFEGLIVGVRVFSVPHNMFRVSLPKSIEVTCCFTVTLHVDLVPYPSAAVQVIVQVPLPFAIICPFEETVATLELEELQLTAVLLAVVGVVFAVRVFVSPTHSVAEEDDRVIDATGCLTVIEHSDFVPYPSTAVQVIVQVPLPFAVITPFEETVATLLSEEAQLTAVLFTVVGVIVAVRVFVSPTQSEVVTSLSAIDVTCCLTVTSHVVFAPYPSAAVQVIVHVPLPLAVITPFEEMVAILLSEDDQLTTVLLASVGVTVVLRALESPTHKVVVTSLSAMAVTGFSTVILHVAVLPL